jgi:hypothetical protein
MLLVLDEFVDPYRHEIGVRTPVFIPHLNDRCQHPHTVYDRATDSPIRRVCGRWRCSAECRDLWRTGMCRRLDDALRVRPVTHHLRLSCLEGLPDRLLSHAHSAFFRRLRRSASLDYFRINEWAEGKRHLHAMIRLHDGRLPTSHIGQLWRKSLPDQTLTHCWEPIADQFALSRYLTKLEELPPPGADVRLHSASRGFFPPVSKETVR